MLFLTSTPPASSITTSASLHPSSLHPASCSPSVCPFSATSKRPLEQSARKTRHPHKDADQGWSLVKHAPYITMQLVVQMVLVVLIIMIIIIHDYMSDGMRLDTYPMGTSKQNCCCIERGIIIKPLLCTNAYQCSTYVRMCVCIYISTYIRSISFEEHLWAFEEHLRNTLGTLVSKVYSVFTFSAWYI